MAYDWHRQHVEDLTLGQRVADSTARVLGSWPFIIAQTVFVSGWVTLNLLAVLKRWDPYPFILLNLMFSIQAAYAAPVIMMSQNREAERDRLEAKADYETNLKAEVEIQEIQESLARLEARLEELCAGMARAPQDEPFGKGGM